jgi:ribosomal protein S27AE
MGDVDRIRVTCTNCGAVIRAKHEHAGRTVTCPKCNAPTTIPPLQMDDDPLPIDTPPQCGIVHWILPSLSLVIAVAALGVAVFRDPLGSGISKYDFTTPRAALESRMKMELNQDIRAMMEFQIRVRGKKEKERLATLEVRKEAEYQGKKILFIAFKVDGVNKYDTESFEKDASTGFWIPAYVGAYEVEKDNKELADQMRRWKSSGELGGK